MLLAKNTDKESQVVEALHKALPALVIVIVIVSVLVAVFYAWYITAPIKKISKMSRRMANMDFNNFCPVERTDEIGVLANSLNSLSSNLSAALMELKEANQKLQADIDKEKELELRRIKFFSAASHELKTPITIIKGQLQGMLCGVGRYKDRETYLAQSLEVTNSLEKMVQELLTVSRIEAPQYSCVKTHFDFTQFLRQRLAAFDDLFVQKELSVAINLLPDIYIDGDMGLLQKVVDNLLGNAATYSPPGNSIQYNINSNCGGILIAYSIEYRKELSNMKKSIIIPLAAVLCLSLLAGCNAKDSSTPPNSKQTDTSAQATVTSSDTSDAYEKLVAFKTANYEQQSVADFNQSLAPDNGDISGLLDAQAEVLASISPDDENYEFITMTLAASLDELYCEQMNDSVGLSAYLKREERPLEKLPGEESVAGAEITYQFVFNALYRLSYTFSDPTQITVADRDNALQKFKTEFQNYVDNLSEADLTSSNIKTVLSEKADELENSLSTAKMKLSCEVESVEVHNAGEEIVNN